MMNTQQRTPSWKKHCLMQTYIKDVATLHMWLPHPLPPLTKISRWNPDWEAQPTSEHTWLCPTSFGTWCVCMCHASGMQLTFAHARMMLLLSTDPTTRACGCGHWPWACRELCWVLSSAWCKNTAASKDWATCHLTEKCTLDSLSYNTMDLSLWRHLSYITHCHVAGVTV